MIATTYEEVHSKTWIAEYIEDQTHELFLLRKVIPFRKIMRSLTGCYSANRGRSGKDLRIMIAISILGKLRRIGDQAVIDLVKENRYAQYFCNVSDHSLRTFLDRSTICRFRRRIGGKGIAMIEHHVFHNLRRSGAIINDASLMDSTVLENNILYPNDVQLLYKAFGKMIALAHQIGIAPWFDEDHVKARWRAFNLAGKGRRKAFLAEFNELFLPAFKAFKRIARTWQAPYKKKAKHWLCVFKLLKKQTRQKLAGEIHIKDRIVSLDELDARPIKKGKAHPACEFGATNQMSFNRQGFMITLETLIGHPNDKTLYPSTLALYGRRMKGDPPCSVTDCGFRSRDNFKAAKDIDTVFLGRSNDVPEEKQAYCKSARSATEGFIAVAKSLRGFKKSRYKGIEGDRIWSLLCQTAYNLRKFLQLYHDEEIEEKALVKLGL